MTVGGSMEAWPAAYAERSWRGATHAAWSASLVSPSALCPGGMCAAKNQVSKRRGSNTGVSQCALATMRSERNTRPSSRSTSRSETSRATSASRTPRHRAAPTCASGPLAEGPASSTPHSSKTSRMAAATYIRASVGEQPSRAAHCSGAGPAHGRSCSPSRSSTPPPGKTMVLGANAICDTRRSMKTSTVEVAPAADAPAGPTWASRTSMTVLARRGVATCHRSPANQRRPASEMPGVVVSGKSRPKAVSRSVPHRDDDLDLDRRVERQRNDADCGAGVNSLVAEGLHQELTGAIDDAGLAGEGGGRGDEAHDLDDARHLVEVADLRPDRGDGVERTGLGKRLRGLGVDIVTHLARRGQGTSNHGQLAGGEDEVAVAHDGNVGRDGRHDLGHGEPQLGQAVLHGTHGQLAPDLGRLK